MHHPEPLIMILGVQVYVEHSPLYKQRALCSGWGGPDEPLEIVVVYVHAQRRRWHFDGRRSVAVPQLAWLVGWLEDIADKRHGELRRGFSQLSYKNSREK